MWSIYFVIAVASLRATTMHISADMCEDSVAALETKLQTRMDRLEQTIRNPFGAHNLAGNVLYRFPNTCM